MNVHELVEKYVFFFFFFDCAARSSSPKALRIVLWNSLGLPAQVELAVDPDHCRWAETIGDVAVGLLETPDDEGTKLLKKNSVASGRSCSRDCKVGEGQD